MGILQSGFSISEEPLFMVGKTISHYKILEKLGEGGMGVIYKAEDTRLKRFVALKFLPPDLTRDDDSKQRFILEAQAASSLDHNNICNIHEIDETDDGQTYIVMACYEGETLKEMIKKDRLQIDQAAGIAYQIALGLEKAHHKGIVHRDIKPGNIIVTDDDVVKIVDFGLAKLAGQTRMTKVGMTLGTTVYLSPEQASGKPVDHRTDIWSLGVVLYEMATQELPFRGEYDQVCIYSILNEEPIPLSRINGEISEEFENIVMMCLQKDPEDRYQSFEELQTALRPLMKDVTTGAVTLAELTPRKQRTYPFLLRMGIVVIIVLMLSLIVSPWRQTVKQWLGMKPKCVAILPFAVIRSDSADQAFCDGLVEMFTQHLMDIEPFQKKLWVLPQDEVRAAEMRTPTQAGHEFMVDWAVTGSMERNSDVLRLVLNVFDTRTLKKVAPSIELKDPIANLSTWQNDALIGLCQLLDLDFSIIERKAPANWGTALPSAYESYIKGCGYLQRHDQEKNLQTAVDLFKYAVDQDPYYALALTGLGRAYWYKYQLSKYQQHFDQAESYLKQAFHIDTQLADISYTLGYIYFNTGRYDDAILHFHQTIRLVPKHFDATIYLAWAYELKGEISDAEDTYENAIDLKPYYWRGYQNLGVFYFQQGRLDKTAKMFLKVTNLRPDYIDGLNNLGAIYYRLGHYDEAADAFLKSITIQPNYDAYSNLGTIYFYQRRYIEATNNYEEAIRLGAKDYIIFGNLADSYRYDSENTEKVKKTYRLAIRSVEEALSINPRNAQDRACLAMYYAKSGIGDSALVEITNAYELAPNDFDVLRKTIIVYELSNERDKAIDMLGQYMGLNGPMDEIERDPDLAGLRQDSRYQKLIK